MRKEYAPMLTARVGELFQTGSAKITMQELYLWFSRNRMTVTAYNELRSLIDIEFEELNGSRPTEDGSVRVMGPFDYGHITLIYERPEVKNNSLVSFETWIDPKNAG